MMEDFVQKVSKSSRILATLKPLQKKEALYKMAEKLELHTESIIEANRLDMQEGVDNGLGEAMLDRLLLDKKRVKNMAKAIQKIANLTEPVGRMLDGWQIDNGLEIQKVSVPIGVIGIIYESRPNVTSDTAALCFKSSNAVILKGGKEAKNSNSAIAAALQEALVESNLPKELISLVPDSSREAMDRLLKMDRYIDLIIPRGGEALIRHVSATSTIPVVKHDKGLCHVYVHKDADIDKAISIAINAKTQRTGVCNAMETLLVDASIAQILLPIAKAEFMTFKTELKGCEKTKQMIDIEEATDEDFHTEYLCNMLSIKVVENLQEAIDHINHYGSKHSEAIVTQNIEASTQFMDEVDASCVYVNASTRFTDGEVFGFGAEVGISTNKLHSRGPMGINDLTTYKYKIIGNGQIRA
jgi:glutamate-5-semialdehyde dehydrogenase